MKLLKILTIPGLLIVALIVTSFFMQPTNCGLFESCGIISRALDGHFWEFLNVLIGLTFIIYLGIAFYHMVRRGR